MQLIHLNRLLRHPSSLQKTTTALLTKQTPQPSSLSQRPRHTQHQNHQPAHRTFTTTTRRPSFTLSQLLRTTRPGRRKSREKPRSPILSTTKRPHMSGVCLRVGVTKPKKPNSGERKTCRVRLSNGKVVDAFIPGEGHNVQQHSVVLVRGGRLQDCPGVRYKCVRGAKQGDLGGVASRRAGRSKYGTKMPKTG